MYTLPTAVFATAQPSSVVATGSVWPAKPKIFTIRSFMENVCRPWSTMTEGHDQACEESFWSKLASPGVWELEGGLSEHGDLCSTRKPLEGLEV